MENVLVLGGTQFFGKLLVQKLLDEGKNVTIATRGLVEDPFSDNVTRLIIDREQKESLEKAFKDKTWDVVYDQSCFSPLEALASMELLQGKIKRYIFTSSQAVYDFGINHKENEFDPASFEYTFKKRSNYVGFLGYQEAKRASEAVLSKQNFFEIVAVRFPIVIGKDDFTNRLKFYVDKVMNKEPIVVGNPEIKISFILSNEAAEFLYFLGQSIYTGPINPGFKEDISLLALLHKVEQVVGNKAVVTEDRTLHPLSPYSLPGSLSINTDKAEKLGFSFSNLQPSIEELIEYYFTNNSGRS